VKLTDDVKQSKQNILNKSVQENNTFQNKENLARFFNRGTPHSSVGCIIWLSCDSAKKLDTIGESESLQDGRENSLTPPLVLHRDFVRFILPPQVNFLVTSLQDGKNRCDPRVFLPFFKSYGKHSCISRIFHVCNFLFSYCTIKAKHFKVKIIKNSLRGRKPFLYCLSRYSWCILYKMGAIHSNPTMQGDQCP